jgi:DNA repair protein RadC
MRIKDIPFFNRPDYRIKKDKELKEDELLSLILWSGNRKENAIDQANRLLDKYNWEKLSTLSYIELSKQIGTVKAIKIRALVELFKKYSKFKRKGFKKTIECAKDVYNYFVDELKDKKKEHFYALLLDSKNRIIKEELISVGTLNSSLVHPREVFKEAIKSSANAIVLVHNHPSEGVVEASTEDLEITVRLKKAGKLLGIKVLDHVIIGNEEWRSIQISNKNMDTGTLT